MVEILSDHYGVQVHRDAIIDRAMERWLFLFVREMWCVNYLSTSFDCEISHTQYRVPVMNGMEYLMSPFASSGKNWIHFPSMSMERWASIPMMQDEWKVLRPLIQSLKEAPERSRVRCPRWCSSTEHNNRTLQTKVKK